MISPDICVVIAAASRSMFAANITLKPAQGAVAPVSSIISRVNSPTLEAKTSAALSSNVRRSPGPVFDHAGKAAAAAATAASTSASPLDGARVAVLPVNGSRRSKDAPSAAGPVGAVDQQPNIHDNLPCIVSGIAGILLFAA